MDDLTLDEALEDLSAAEEFLEYFGIEYDARTVQVNRLHILQRFHNYIGQAGDLPADEAPRRAVYARLLQQAYEDFVKSDALTEKVFKVFHMHEPQTTFVPLGEITLNKAGAPVAPAPAAGGCGCGSSSSGSCSSSMG
ncbi:nitrogenase-stabilizing/protective protein NifW [Thiobacillus sp.]|uniref:nitrogenase-stabilizing/protective protein NifW n=1 Tax=Thiobacillus sp. TaxID=924 RepID=UPI0017CF9A79|nr:nitrogenase-stabilizing/protective protein NifW [Thiobacillus sp.]MBC2729799.1 nitrogen fixation protein NifW [Thiobacillus sp.]MBC2738535.1 nitrogenase-stabilizing/protective protein NifW [Thiobacillus sp.]MBC2761185.1 nitrogenase-stabilizing/protective protein NifW [Thiobacillus sp.]